MRSKVRDLPEFLRDKIDEMREKKEKDSYRKIHEFLKHQPYFRKYPKTLPSYRSIARYYRDNDRYSSYEPPRPKPFIYSYPSRLYALTEVPSRHANFVYEALHYFGDKPFTIKDNNLLTGWLRKYQDWKEDDMIFRGKRYNRSIRLSEDELEQLKIVKDTIRPRKGMLNSRLFPGWFEHRSGKYVRVTYAALIFALVHVGMEIG